MANGNGSQNTTIQLGPGELDHIAGILGVPPGPGWLPTPPAPPPDEFSGITGAPVALDDPMIANAGYSLPPGPAGPSTSAAPLVTGPQMANQAQSVGTGASGLGTIPRAAAAPMEALPLGAALPSAAQAAAGARAIPYAVGPGMPTPPPPPPPPTTRQKILGALGKIGGLALSAVAPGVAAQIPQTPLGQIAQQRRELETQKALTEEEKARAQTEDVKSQEEYRKAQVELMKNTVPVTLANGQTVYVPQKDAAKLLGTTETTQARRDIATGAQQTQRDIAGSRDVANIDIAQIRAGAAENKPKTPVLGTRGQGGPQLMGQFIPNKGWVDSQTGQPVPNFIQTSPYAQTVAPVQYVSPETGLPAVGTMPRTGAGPITPATVAPPPGSPPGTPSQPAISATGPYARQMEQAAAVYRGADKLIAAVNANKSKFGNMHAIINSALGGTPLADPATQGLQTQIRLFVGQIPGMEGLRGQKAIDGLASVIGGIPENPDALVEALEKAKENSVTINPYLAPQRPGAAGGGILSPSEWKAQQK